MRDLRHHFHESAVHLLTTTTAAAGFLLAGVVFFFAMSIFGDRELAPGEE